MTASSTNKTDQVTREQRLLHAIVDACPVPMALNDDAGNVVFLNAEFVHTFGYTRQDIPTVAEWWPRAYPDPAYRQSIAHTWQTHLEEAISAGWRTFRPVKAKIRCKNGSERTANVSGAPLGDAYAGLHLVVLADITESVVAAEALKASEDHYRTLFETIPVGVVYQDASGQITSANPAACRILGLTFDQMRGVTSIDPRWNTVHEDGSPFPGTEHPAMVALRTGQAVTDVVMGVFNPVDERHTWINVSAVPLFNGETGELEQVYASFQDISHQRESAEVIWRQANFDALTGLPNRNMLRDRLLQSIKQTQRDNRVLALLFIDLDRFKEVNDTLGHAVGDALLIEAARRIRACIREADTAARLGGDEFTVVLPQLPDCSMAEEIAQKLITRLEEPFHVHDNILYVTASIGITLYPADADDVHTLLRNADQAMYVAKGLGRNRVSYYTPALQQAAEHRLRLINDLRTAQREGQFCLHFQPIVELATGRIHKAEALLRWHHPTRGIVSPSEFVPLTEEIGLINAIGDWVFEESATWAKRWNDMFGRDFQVSVNVSPIQFRRDGPLCRGTWIERLKSAGLAANAISAEITEGVLLNADEAVTSKLLELRDEGMQVAIDDFGTGYSSLAYLKHLHIDYLKIDRTFVRDLATDANDRVLAEAMIALAHKLGLKVIAEGVETEEQLALLKMAGCDYAQGYLYARPLEPVAFEELLSQSSAAVAG